MRTYNYIKRIIDRLTTMESNNAEFTLYNHLVDKQSCMGGFFAATIYADINRYSGEVATFSFDYWTHHLYIEGTANSKVTEAIKNAFRLFYPSWLKITDDTLIDEEE